MNHKSEQTSAIVQASHSGHATIWAVRVLAYKPNVTMDYQVGITKTLYVIAASRKKAWDMIHRIMTVILSGYSCSEALQREYLFAFQLKSRGAFMITSIRTASDYAISRSCVNSEEHVFVDADGDINFMCQRIPLHPILPVQ